MKAQGIGVDEESPLKDVIDGLQPCGVVTTEADLRGFGLGQHTSVAAFENWTEGAVGGCAH